MVKGAVREKIWLGSRTKKAIKKGAKKVENDCGWNEFVVCTLVLAFLVEV